MKKIKLIDMSLVDICRHSDCNLKPGACPNCKSEKVSVDDDWIKCPCCMFEASLAGWQAKNSYQQSDPEA